MSVSYEFENKHLQLNYMVSYQRHFIYYLCSPLYFSVIHCDDPDCKKRFYVTVKTVIAHLCRCVKSPDETHVKNINCIKQLSQFGIRR